MHDITTNKLYLPSTSEKSVELSNHGSMDMSTDFFFLTQTVATCTGLALSGGGLCRKVTCTV